MLLEFDGVVTGGAFNMTTARQRTYTGAWAIEDSAVAATNSQSRVKADQPANYFRLECTADLTGGATMKVWAIAVGE
jgi:hypothetical protein